MTGPVIYKYPVPFSPFNFSIIPGFWNIKLLSGYRGKCPDKLTPQKAWLNKVVEKR
jgi:hypothetical protein